MTEQSASRSERCTCARFPEEHERDRLCGIGFNGFLGEVQNRLMEAGYHPPLWPDPTISDQGDMDEALDVCVKWCKGLLDAAAVSEQRTLDVLRRAVEWHTPGFLPPKSIEEHWLADARALTSERHIDEVKK